MATRGSSLHGPQELDVRHPDPGRQASVRQPRCQYRPTTIQGLLMALAEFPSCAREIPYPEALIIVVVSGFRWCAAVSLYATWGPLGLSRRRRLAAYGSDSH